MASITIPEVTDHQFAHGLDEIPPPAGSLDGCGTDVLPWVDRINDIRDLGLGERPQVVMREGMDLVRSIRFLGALLATLGDGTQQGIVRVATWAALMFEVLEPDRSLQEEE